jgi:hypothetical protein
MPRRAFVGLAATLVALAGACGESGGGGGGGDAAAGFRADADAVCSERNRAVVQAYDTARDGGKRGLALDEATNRAQIEGETSVLDGLKGLEPPAGLDAAYTELLAAHEHRRDLLEVAERALEKRDAEAAVADGERASALQDEIYALGRALGLETCAGAVPADQRPAITAAVERQLTARGASSVEIIEIEGNDQYAEAEVLSRGGDFDSEAVNVHVSRDGEAWSVAEVEQVGSGR